VENFNDAIGGSVIYLLRHGDAEDGDGDDAARRLTAKGKHQRQRRAARSPRWMPGSTPA
jgi:phosphohistidine phosphatase SixA